MMTAAERSEQGIALSPELDQALNHGTSIGGARPKALLADGDKKLIAKFSSSTDVHPVVKVEFLAMRLAARVGLDVAPVRRSEEHTSELQSLMRISYAVFCLKKTKKSTHNMS